jgi:hypothetical protein
MLSPGLHQVTSGSTPLNKHQWHPLSCLKDADNGLTSPRNIGTTYYATAELPLVLQGVIAAASNPVRRAIVSSVTRSVSNQWAFFKSAWRSLPRGSCFGGYRLFLQALFDRALQHRSISKPPFEIVRTI